MYLSPRDIDVPIGTELVERAISGQSTFATVETTEGMELRVFATPFIPDRPVMLPPRGMPGPAASRVNIESAALVIGRPTEDIRQALDRLLHTLMIAVPLTLVAAGGGGIFLVRRALKPVAEMTQKARSIEEHDLSQRIEVKTKDELGRLASTLNEMIGRLETAFKRQKQFTGDASHELRAPLAIIEAESTLTLRKDRTKNDYQRSLETISQEARRMSHIVDQLLALARADSGREKLSLRRVNLSRLVTKIGADVEMSGVKIGQIEKIDLDQEKQAATVRLKIKTGIELTDDVIASVKTAGLIGDKYISILAGGSDEILENGGYIIETESAVDLEDLISKYVFGQTE